MNMINFVHLIDGQYKTLDKMTCTRPKSNKELILHGWVKKRLAMGK
jgi:hypothetical protein